MREVNISASIRFVSKRIIANIYWYASLEMTRHGVLSTTNGHFWSRKKIEHF